MTDTPSTPLTLPTRMTPISTSELDQLRIRTERNRNPGEEVPGTETFLCPKGWSLIPTASACWQHLLDERGNRRAAVFCDPTLDTRQWYVTFKRALNISYLTLSAPDGAGNVKQGRITRGNAVIYETAPVHYDGNGFAAQTEVVRLLEAHLAEHYPAWNQSVIAYWD